MRGAVGVLEGAFGRLTVAVGVRVRVAVGLAVGFDVGESVALAVGVGVGIGAWARTGNDMQHSTLVARIPTTSKRSLWMAVDKVPAP